MARDLLRDVLGDEAAASISRRPAGHLGVGVQQILEIARALADQARVIVLDEPTAALTDGEIERLFALVRAPPRDRRLVRLHLAPARRDRARCATASR